MDFISLETGNPACNEGHIQILPSWTIIKRGRREVNFNHDIRTVIDIGGRDAKVISLGEDGRVIDFIINDRCASGTGRFLESAARLVLNVPPEELGRLSSMAIHVCKISSTCTVIAQTEIDPQLVGALEAALIADELVAG